jgi:hypothetical protein
MPDVVRVNNTIYSWTSCRFLIDAQPWTGLVSVDYEEKRERKIVYAARQAGIPLGWTSGKYSVPTFSMKFLRDSGNALTDYLTTGGLINPGAGSFGDAEWTFMLQTVEPTVGSIPITTVGVPCTIIGSKETHEEGIEELVTEFDIACLSLRHNGKQLWSAVRQVGI